MHVDTTTLETQLGIQLTKEDWNLLATHHTITKRCIRRAQLVLVRRIRPNEYLVTPTY